MHAETTLATLPMAIDGRTRIYPVIGNPVAQVQAPAAFNPLFTLAGVNAVAIPLGLPPTCVVDTCRSLLGSASVGGLLVTVPYKQVLAQLADRLDPAAARVGAINALRLAKDGCIEGALLDGLGFAEGLRAAAHTIAGRSVLLVGAGGAGGAVADALADGGACSIDILDVDMRKAQTLAARLQSHFPACRIAACGTIQGSRADIAINATPLGMRPGDALPFEPAALPADALVVDIIMEPARTRLLELAQARGMATHPGRPMLDGQVPAYLGFFGLPALAAIATERNRQHARTTA